MSECCGLLSMLAEADSGLARGMSMSESVWDNEQMRCTRGLKAVLSMFKSGLDID